MHEQSSPTPRYEVAGQHEMLHQSQLELPMTVLLDKQAALASHAINGDVLATVSLPVPEGAEPRIVAVVDYGEFDPEAAPARFVMDGQPITRVFGRAKTRYELTAFSYTPSEHLGSAVPLKEGETTIGRTSRQGGDASYMLGLNESKREHEEISREHATFVLENGVITIKDHSTNGTEVTIPSPETSNEPGLQSHVALRGLAKLVDRRKSN